MNKKRAVFISLLLCLVLLFTGCQAGAGPSGESNQASSAAKSDTKLTITSGVLTMATNAYFPPYEYYEGAEIQGIDVEIAKEIASRLDLELEIENMKFKSIIPAVKKGKADIGLAGISITKEREKSIDFSESYASGIQSVIVLEESGIESIEQLDGEKIGVKIHTTGNIYASEEFGENNLVRYNEGIDAVSDLVKGEITAVVIDNEPAKSYASKTKGLKILPVDLAKEDYAICISKGNEELKEAVNKALNDMKNDGTLQAILDRFITE